jgi:hypothetical protein
MRNLFLTPALAAAIALAAGCTVEEGVDDATLRVVNSSDYTIVEIYLTEVGSSSWGRNLMAGDELRPGEDLVLGVDCGFYDALIVDEDNVDCELHDLDLCLNDADWVIRNNTCTVFGAKKAEREAVKAAQPDAAL